MDYLAVFVVGIIFGWIIFERPQWSKDAFAWLKIKMMFWKTP